MSANATSTHLARILPSPKEKGILLVSVEAIDQTWNRVLKNFDFLRLVVTGSAASWMIRNFVNNKAGLHNRLTAKIQLKPFSLGETLNYILARGIPVTKYQALELYMALGGIPYYLNYLRSGETPAQAISRLCFGAGPLRREYHLLYASLFVHHKAHDAITKALASKKKGLTREELVLQTGLSSGGWLTTRLDELIHSGFVELIEPIYENDWPRYRLLDPFVLFALKWIESAGFGSLSEGEDEELFLKIQKSQEFSSWQGHIFEGICLMHAKQIKEALGIRLIRSKMGPWSVRRRSEENAGNSVSGAKKRGRPPKISQLQNTAEKGSEIDLVIDREDGAISLCEVKYYSEVFEITESYANKLDEKKRIFQETCKAQKSLYTVIISPHGVKDNAHRRRCVQNEVTIDDLFLK